MSELKLAAELGFTHILLAKLFKVNQCQSSLKPKISPGTKLASTNAVAGYDETLNQRLKKQPGAFLTL